MATFKKIIFWLVTVVCMLMLVVSVVYTYEPSWFSGLIELLAQYGITEEQIGATLATFGWGGTAGTTGFSIIRSTIVKNASDSKEISNTTVTAVSESNANLTAGIKKEYDNLYDQYIKQNTTIQEMKKALVDHKASFDTLASSVNRLIDLEIININKTIDNPLTNPDTANKLKEQLVSLNKAKETVTTTNNVVQDVIDKIDDTDTKEVAETPVVEESKETNTKQNIIGNGTSI